jgi:prevent-host-death family protein
VEIEMAVTTLTSREFNQDTSRAKKAARRGPVFITDRGRPAHVLLTIEDYRRLTGGEMTLAEALAQPDNVDFEFEPPRFGGGLFKPADL